jgi:hypothetical protein
VDEPVMERADQHQVVEVRSPTLVPPDDVVGLREASRATSGESALAVPVLQVSNHPRRGLSGHATEPDGQTALLFDDGLDPCVARQPTSRVRADRRPVLDLALAQLVVGSVEARVHDQRRPVRVTIGVVPRRTQGDEGIGPPRTGPGRPVLFRHDRQAVREPVEHLRDDRALCGGQLGLQAESAAFVERPPRQESAAIRLLGLARRPARDDVGLPPDRAARNVTGPDQQARLGLRCGEPRQLDRLVDVQLARCERLGGAGERLERVSGGDPSSRLPLGQAVPDREPVRRVASADVSPARPSVDVGEKPEQPTMARRETRMLGVDLADQLVFAVVVHPDLARSRGRKGSVSNIRSDVKDIDRHPRRRDRPRGRPTRVRSSGRAPSR